MQINAHMEDVIMNKETNNVGVVRFFGKKYELINFLKEYQLDHEKFINALNEGFSVAKAKHCAEGGYKPLVESEAKKPKKELYTGRTKKTRIDKGQKSPIELRGKEYASYTDISKKLNIEYRFLMRRLSKGYTLEEAVDLSIAHNSVRRTGANRIECQDHLSNWYPSRNEMVRIFF